MHELIDSFKEVEKGNLQVSISHDTNNEFGYLYTHFNEMTRNLRTLIDQVYNQKILMHRAELKQLQSQINPHFLYNSFFMLNTMVRINDENLIQFTKYLGEYFRYITRNTYDYAPLTDEINHAKVYVNIQLIRFPNRLKVEFGICPKNFEDFSVPRLILQPIIENAFEHGLGKKNKDGVILVNFISGNSNLDIVIEDNGNELSDGELEDLRKLLESEDDKIEITGIINIHRRIKLVFGNDSGLEVSRSHLGGLKVKVMLRTKGGEGYLQATDS
jgi:two-component system sensor histidine kinase YesM